MAMMAYRSSRQESTGQTPYLMLFGREIDMPVDVVYGRPAPEELPEDTTAYVEQLRETLEEAHELARRSTGQSSARQKRNYDHRSRGSKYQVGDAVWLFRPQVTKGRSKKLRRPWCGPYTVMTCLDDITFQIRRSANSKPVVVHYDRLKPYLGDRYQPVGQFENGPEVGTPGRATGDSVGDSDADDDNDSHNDSEQDDEGVPLLTPDGASPGVVTTRGGRRIRRPGRLAGPEWARGLIVTSPELVV